MGALIGLAVQLTMLAIGLMITLVVWTVRLTGVAGFASGIATVMRPECDLESG